MGIITWVIFVFTAVRLAVVFYNWISPLYLPHTPESDIPELSILIPARNEENSLPYLLEDILSLPGIPCEVLVYDDLSTDNTASIVLSFSRRNPAIRLIQGRGLPSGWLGKNNACHQLAREATGKYFLFLDADVRIAPDFPLRAIRYMQRQRIALLSLFPRQLITHRGTWLTVPLMNWILLTLLPVPLVQKLPQPSLAAANGQCMLFTVDSYRKLLPHQVMKEDTVEDISIMRFYKSNGLPVSLLLGSDDISCRMYAGLADSVNGFSKNIFRFFGNSSLLAFFICCFYNLFRCVACYSCRVDCFFVYIILIVWIRIFFSAASRQPVWLNVLAGIPQQLFFWIILVNAWIKIKQRTVRWKGRVVSGSSV
ncbi:MAG: glycosyltransferase [Tannerellaceae bacterium]|nr:glycosyltransferase [Tannerellaceae bacterium]